MLFLLNYHLRYTSLNAIEVSSRQDLYTSYSTTKLVHGITAHAFGPKETPVLPRGNQNPKLITRERQVLSKWERQAIQSPVSMDMWLNEYGKRLLHTILFSLIIPNSTNAIWAEKSVITCIPGLFANLHARFALYTIALVTFKDTSSWTKIALNPAAYLTRTVEPTFKTNWTEIIFTALTKAVVFQGAVTAIAPVLFFHDTLFIMGAIIAPDTARASATHLNVLLDSFVLLQNPCHGNKAFSQSTF